MTSTVSWSRTQIPHHRSFLSTDLSCRALFTMVSYDAYESKLDAIGEAILNWSDKERNFRGYTEVREWFPESDPAVCIGASVPRSVFR
jgi:hypothetical protein